MECSFSKILSKYLRMIDGSERRLNIARKYKCHEVVVEVSLHVVLDRLNFAIYVDGHFFSVISKSDTVYLNFNNLVICWWMKLSFIITIYAQSLSMYKCFIRLRIFLYAYNRSWQCTCKTRQFDILTNAFML